MAKQENKRIEFEREYIIPLRKETDKVARYRKAEKAIKAVKKFLARHMKIYDRDLNKIKIDKYLNEEIWHRGIKNPPAKLKVRAIKEKDKNGKETVMVELVDYPEKLKFKKAREEKIEKRGEEVTKKKKEEKVKTEEETKTETESEMKEKEEKKAAVVEAGQKIAEQQHKKAKHEVSGKQKGPKHQFRQALQK